MISLNTRQENLELVHQPLLNVLMLPDCRSVNPYQDLLARSLEANGVRVVFPQGYRRVFPLFREIVQRSETNVLHLHWIAPYLRSKSRFVRWIYAAKFLVDILLVKWRGVRVVWTIHNRIPHEAMFPDLELWVRRGLARLADRLIVHNQATLEDLAKEFSFPLQKAVLIPHGHYRNVYQPAIPKAEARKLLNLPPEGTIFLTLGLLRGYKGIETLLETWRSNRSDFSACTLVIAGKASPAYAEKLRLMSADLPNVVLIPEFVEDDRIHLFFSAATVVVLPYQKILNSGSLILAMSYGVPVIAPAIGSLSEYLGNANSLLFNPNDEQGLLKVMRQSLQTDLEQVSQLTVQACDRLDWQPLGTLTSKVYFDISRESA